MDYFNKKTVEDLNILGKRVLLRCDFNVPFDTEGKIANTRRITESLKTIKYLLDRRAKIVLCSHLGRPNGKFDSKFSLKPVAECLSKTLKKEIKLSKDVAGEDTRALVESLNEAEIVLLENLRFCKGETENDRTFASELASLADVFVNDAFGAAHRSHASTVGVTEFLPSACGFLMLKEISTMTRILKNPTRPFVAILGGAKVSDKIGVISNLLDKVDTLIVAGGMAYTFMNSLGYSIGNSICENDKISLAVEIMAQAKGRGVKFLIPVDNKVGLEYSKNTEFKTVQSDSIPDGWMGLDIGPRTEVLFKDALKDAETVIWNGPMGVAEWENFSSGTFSVAKTVASSKAFSVVGGGDCAAAIEKLGYANEMSHISTGGGALLVLLEGKGLPAVVALSEKNRVV
ncbi:MAG: phosphoglycerate kinase [Oscillospiraceae bacterium]|jgi:phosphoglycerate kinase|nr:phosphoglycerate kinase [Oscillospiraceae bacterium]